MKTGTMLIAAMTLAFSACSTLHLTGNSSGDGGSPKTAALTGGTELPAAQGEARFSSTKNGNTGVDVTVKHLAHPERLTPPATTYVVWLQKPGAAPQNMGALKVDDKLDGDLTIETPMHAFDLFVTAEPSGQVDRPSGPKLLWTSYSS